MSRARKWFPWRPSPVTLIAAALVIGGMALTSVSWGFVALVGLGTFGPGVLRELGWLRDKDEWQLRAAQRAGYHAFLVAGLVAFCLVAVFRSGDREIKDSQELATLFLVLMWCTWFFSSLFAFWGAQKTAVRVLLAFGGFWWLFIIMSNNDSFVGFLMHSLVVLPFFALALVARRWPRVAGVLLIVATGFFVYFFGWYKRGHTGEVTQAITMIMFLGPLLSSGVALLGVGREEERSTTVGSNDKEDFQ